MSFLQPFLLWGIAGAAIPVIIHLLNRRRFRTVNWAATQFLLKATQESRGRKRLKYILILTCRALAIAALAFAIARPLTGGLLGWGSGSVGTVVLLLDRSASMERSEGKNGLSKREVILQQVANAMNELDGARLVLIDSASGAPQEVPSPSLLPELSTTAATDGAADIPGMLTSALEYLKEAEAGQSEIWIASDMQSGDWQPKDQRWEAYRATVGALSQEPRVRILALTSREGTDYSIRVINSRRENQELLVDVEIFRDNDEAPSKIPLTTSLTGTATTVDIEIEGQSLIHQTRLPLDGRNRKGYGWVAIGPDANPRNNVSYFAFGPDAPIHSYLVAEESTSAEASQALLKAAAPGFANQEITQISPEDAALIDWGKTSLILWRAPLPEDSVEDQLQNFIESGGIVLFFPPDGESDRSFAGLSWQSTEESPEGRYFIVQDWERTDGPLRDGIDGNPIPLPRLRAIQRRGIQGPASTLAKWDDESPFLVRNVLGKGAAFFLTTNPDYNWSNLEHTAIHLVLAQRTLALGSRRHAQGFLGIAGTESALAIGDEIRTRLDKFAEPDLANADYHAAVYQFGERTVAVNRPEEEDSILTLDTTLLLQETMADTKVSLFEETTESDSTLVREVWRAFLIAMLLFLIAEALLCLQPKKETNGSVTPLRSPS